MLWGGWLLVTAALFSFGQGHHPSLLHGRTRPGDRRGRRDRRGHALVAARSAFAQCALAAVFAVTVVWSYMLARSNAELASVDPGRRWRSAASWWWPRWSRGRSFRGARAPVVVAAGAVAVGLLGPGAYTVATAATPHSGAIPSAGPAGRERVPVRAASVAADSVAGGTGRGLGAGGFAGGGFGRAASFPAASVRVVCRRCGRRLRAAAASAVRRPGAHGAARSAGSVACSTART